MDTLQEDWSDEQLCKHQAIAWYLDTDSQYPDDEEGEKTEEEDDSTNDESTDGGFQTQPTNDALKMKGLILHDTQCERCDGYVRSTSWAVQ